MAPAAKTSPMSEEGLERLKKAEPYRQTAYRDGKNGMSIGHGVNNKHHPDIYARYGPSVTREQAHQQLVDVNIQHARDLRRRCGAEAWDSLQQGQRDGLLGAAYNAGPRRVAEEVRADLQKQNWEGVAKKLENMAPYGFIGTEKVDLSSRRKADADYFLRNSSTEDSTHYPDSPSAGVSGAVVAGAASGTIVAVPVSVAVGGTTFSLVTGASLSTGIVNIGIAVSLSNPVTAICCAGGFMVLSALAST